MARTKQTANRNLFVRLTDQEFDDFEEYCFDLNVTKSDAVRELIAAAVKRHKRKYLKTDGLEN